MRCTERWRYISAVAVAAAALAWGLPVAPWAPLAQATEPAAETVTEGPDHTVRVSAVHPDHPTFHYTAFYPGTLQIHRGDLVRWEFLDSFAGWHSVTFAPEDMDVALHPEPVYPDQRFPTGWGIDETGGVKIPDYFALGSPDGFLDEQEPCGRGPLFGRPAQPACVLSSTEQLIGSSVSDTFMAMADEHHKTFDVRVDLEPGRYRYHCVVHPAMVGEIEVVSDDVALDPYTDDEFAADLAADTVAAQAIADRYRDVGQAYDPATGEWTVRVTEGTDDGRVLVNEYLPADITVRPGDTVRFIAGGEVAGSNEPNTVLFPAELAGSLCHEGTPSTCPRPHRFVGLQPLGATAFVWGCDPDDPNAGLPLVPLSWSLHRGCPDGTLEWVLTRYMSHPEAAPGNAVISPGTYHSSGIMMPSSLPDGYRGRGDGTDFLPEFMATFPVEGAFPFRCLAHPDYMDGTIRVAA